MTIEANPIRDLSTILGGSLEDNEFLDAGTQEVRNYRWYGKGYPLDGDVYEWVESGTTPGEYYLVANKEIQT